MTDFNEGAALSDAVTAVNTALATMRNLGLSDQADAIVAAAAQSAPYTALDADTDHNDDWKRTQYARAYTTVMTGLARKLTTAATTAGASGNDDTARVYGIKGLPGDVASLSISRRDAGDRVAGITDSTQLRRLLDTAVRTGDEVLAHAIVEVAIGFSDTDTVDAFIAAYPDLADATQRLWDADHRKMSTVDLTAAWRVAALKPAALGSLQNYEIAAAAAGQANVGSWNV
jgi:hypothetical protein